MKLHKLYKKFKTHKDCLLFLERIRWDGNPVCPYCEATYQTPIPSENRYHCNNCNTSFSVTVGTPFHKTKADLQKWFAAIDYVMNGGGKTLRELGEHLGVTKDTASFMVNRIKKEKTDNPIFLQAIINKL